MKRKKNFSQHKNSSSSAAFANEDEDWLCDTSRNYVCQLRVPLNRILSLLTKMASRSFAPSMLYVSNERSMRSYLIWGCPAIINRLLGWQLIVRATSSNWDLSLKRFSSEMISLMRQFIMEINRFDKNSTFDLEKPNPFSSVYERIGVARSEENWVAMSFQALPHNVKTFGFLGWNLAKAWKQHLSFSTNEACAISTCLISFILLQ